jgi:hypothetical protein
MLHILQRIRELGHDLRASAREAETRVLLGSLAALLLVGTVFYSWVEGWSALDALYFSEITLATVGYGDLAPRTPLGKVFTIGYLLLGLGTFVLLVTLLAELRMRGRMRRLLEQRERRRAARAARPPTSETDQKPLRD